MSKEDYIKLIEELESNIHNNSKKLREVMFDADDYDKNTLNDIVFYADLIQYYSALLKTYATHNTSN